MDFQFNQMNSHLKLSQSIRYSEDESESTKYFDSHGYQMDVSTIEYSNLDLTFIAVDSSGSVHCKSMSNDDSLPTLADYGLSAYFSSVHTVINQYFLTNTQINQYFLTNTQIIGARWAL